MDLRYVYNPKRHDMGRQVMFCIAPTELCDSIVPDPQEARRYILRNPVHEHMLHAPRFSHHEVNTVRVKYTNTSINHAEGGWPKDVNINDPEATQRYRRKIEKDDSYIQCVMKHSEAFEHYIFQNNAIDMYRTYYSEFDQFPKQDQSECRTVNVFRDDPSNDGHRPVSSICWNPDGLHRFAASYVNLDFNRNTRSSVNAYIWDVEKPRSPEMTIVPPCGMLDLQYNPKHTSFLAGALVNGQVAAWDVRKSGAPAFLCPPHVAHRDAVRNVLFINAKTGMEFFSAGIDGVIKWWDLRSFGEPYEELCLDMVKLNEQQSMSRAKGVSVLEFENTIPTRFMVGTEDGLVITGNRKGKTVEDKLPGKFNAHVGPVRALHRNPAFLKNFLTVGGWTARVWSEDCRDSAILWTAAERHAITDGIWSPTRVSLLMLAKYNGMLSIWDLLRRQHEPVLTVQVCEEPLTKVCAHEAGTLLACGSRTGSVFLLELSPNLGQSDKNDKPQLTEVLERETKRERILEARLRELRVKQRQAAESPRASLASQDAPAAGDADLTTAAAEYFTAVKKELTSF